MYIKCAVLVVLLVAEFQTTLQISLPNDETYYAAVVEFPPSSSGTAKAKVKDNLQRMKAIIESEETRDLDILVFPEYVLNNMEWKTFVPDPLQKIAPCDIPNNDWFLTEMSCAARSRNLYVVINLLEKEFCGNRTIDCDKSGFNTYNTNVVLDRQGRVISRYRKTNLYRYEWYSTNVKVKPELATFDTDFGVTFGHFICFDMLFYEPSMVLINELNITDIIYPTYWFSELPFLTAVQLQEGWAFANDVNLLAANANYPSEQNTGSGIYAGKLGRISASIYEDETTKVHKARVPKHLNRSTYEMPPITIEMPTLETKRLTKIGLLRDYNVDIFRTKLLPSNFTAVKELICHNTFCCQFDVNRTLISNSQLHSSYLYRLAAFSGVNTTHQRMDPSELSICAVIACTSTDLYSCGYIFPEGVPVANKYYFNYINITGKFRKANRRLIMPSTVDGAMMPLPVTTFVWNEIENANSTEVSITLNSSKADLLTFGIWANYYTTAVSSHNLNPSLPEVLIPTRPTPTSAGILHTPKVFGILSGLFVLFFSIKTF
ncbi:vanin-like protein 1 [Teleopsis dalmanni]|uniref:vanin-like protein 1 n=1 Tax=Teleopsis dalmanni TaxID=139649 RepID=UPI0018CF130E|nr:vanin-like protein 1 [Teleopsis dalmanni]